MTHDLDTNFVPSGQMLSLIGTCVSRLTDVVLITEALPTDEPGPRIVFVNDAFSKQTGYSREEAIGQTPRMLQGALTDKDVLKRISDALALWKPVRAELVNYTKSGTTFDVEMDIVPIAGDDGIYTHWVSVQRDITARKRAHRTNGADRANSANGANGANSANGVYGADGADGNPETERAASLTKLSIGIAHDFNTIIAAILGNVVLGREDIAHGQTALPALAQIDHAATRARGLVQQILSSARQQPHALRRQPLARLVGMSCELLRSTLPPGISLNVSLESLEMDVLGDASQFDQLLLNLGTNAWHAMPHRRGHLDIRLTAIRAALGWYSEIPLPQQALLEVRDDGQGMDAATLRRLFEPYFTTKLPGHGTGLGLSVVDRVVKAHGASISVESEPGIGTTFKIIFPVLAPGVDKRANGGPHAAQPGMPELAGAKKSILLVDDDDVSRILTQTILERAGFEVLALSDPVRAIGAVESQPAGFDLVLTDLNMPEMSGLQLASRIATIRRDIPVVVGTGYLEEDFGAAALRAGVTAVFQKGLVAERLVQLIHDSLGIAASPTFAAHMAR